MEYEHNGQHHRFDVNPILVGLLGVLAGAIIVAICHCIIVFCNDTQGRMVNNIATTITANNNNNNNNNATEHPTVQVIVQSKEYKEDVCCICLGQFKQDERVRVLPECAHVFHVTCIDKWLQHHSNCPMCRASTIHPPLVHANSSPEIHDRISGLGGGGGGGGGGVD